MAWRYLAGPRAGAVLVCISTGTETGAAGSKWERQKSVQGAGLVAPTQLAWPWQLHFASSGRGTAVLKSDSETERGGGGQAIGPLVWFRRRGARAEGVA